MDTTPPNAPTSLIKFASQNQGSNKNVTFQWTLPNPVSSDAGRLPDLLPADDLDRRLLAATCTPILTNRCIVVERVRQEHDSYQTYLVYYDNAGNLSAASNTITV